LKISSASRSKEKAGSKKVKSCRNEGKFRSRTTGPHSQQEKKRQDEGDQNTEDRPEKYRGISTQAALKNRMGIYGRNVFFNMPYLEPVV